MIGISDRPAPVPFGAIGSSGRRDRHYGEGSSPARLHGEHDVGAATAGAGLGLPQRDGPIPAVVPRLVLRLLEVQPAAVFIQDDLCVGLLYHHL